MWNQFGKAFVDYLKRADIILWLLLAGISTYSLLLLKSVSRATPDDYFRTQGMAIGLGVCGAVFVSLMDYADLAGF